ncbi:MAG: site-specific DNA-methyltransferase [Candidatus Saccharimonadales bacterium]
MDENDTDIYEVSGASPEFRTQLAKQLEELVPEAIADGKVDVAKLKELLQEDAGDTNERFGLFWPGKKRAMRAAQEPTTATLKPAKEQSKDWDTTQNIFIEGDNLEVLKVLQKQYHNAIKMIYIDPPYNTGKDFVYPDNFAEGLQNYLEFSKQVDDGSKKISTNTETAGRYHSNWLNMMYPRLKLARNLLTDDGVIFISIDDAEYVNLKKICDEIFGESNQLESLVWKKRATPPNDRNIGRIHEYVLVYARHSEKVSLGLLPRDEKSVDRYSNPDNDPRGPWSASDLSANGKGGRLSLSTIYPITNPADGKEYMPTEGRCWLFGKDKMQRYIEEGRVSFRTSTGAPYLKRYLKEVRNGLTLPTILLESGFSSTSAAEVNKLFDGRAIFEYPKPTLLMKHLLTIGMPDGGYLLDFFSGSGTVAHAVMQLNAEDGGNRKHIQVQLPEPTDEKSEAYKAGYRKISDIARERINRAGEKIKVDFADKLAERDAPLDIGYRTYQLSDTNFRKWQSSATNDLGELQARLDLMRESADDNASEEDLLVEVMLKMGLPLTSRTASREVTELTVHQVVPEDEEHADVQPVFYLNEHVKPTLEQLRRLVTELTPSKFVILDDAFQGDNELKTNLVQTCKSYDVELWTV